LPLVQSVSTLQLVVQALFEHMYGAQPCVGGIGAVQAPVAHAFAFVSVLLMHEGFWQTVPLAYLRQAPAPSQDPSVPHEPTPESVHSLSGSLPAVMGPQVPSAPLPFFTVVQATQVPLHALLQQTPSAQKPVVHWLFAVHGPAPVTFLVQTPPPQ
jgi:hypothetical protein